jgi:hypothetical protein
VSTNTAMPTAATGSPTPVISKTPSGSPPCATSRSETTRLVEVPITVTTPPNTAAYDRGIRYGEADAFERRHHVTTRGAASATNGVFGRTADSAPLSTASRPSRARLCCASLASRRAGDPASTRSISGDNAPVTVAAPASTYSAAIVIGADDDRPDSASPWSTTSVRSSTPTAAPIAAAVGRRSNASTPKVTISTTNVTQASVVTMQRSPCAHSCIGPRRGRHERELDRVRAGALMADGHRDRRCRLRPDEPRAGGPIRGADRAVRETRRRRPGELSEGPPRCAVEHLERFRRRRRGSV